MRSFVHRQNIEHYRGLLAGDTLDDAQRARVKELLSEEEAKELPFPPRARDDD